MSDTFSEEDYKKAQDLFSNLFGGDSGSLFDGFDFSKLSQSGADKFKNQAEKARNDMFNAPGILVSMANKNTGWIYKREYEIVASKDEMFIEAFGVVAAHDGKLDISSRVFVKVNKDKNSRNESLGILAHEQGQYQQAITYLEGLKRKSKFGKIAHSLSWLHEGDYDKNLHKSILKGLEEQPMWNHISGLIHYKNSNYKRALPIFESIYDQKKSQSNLLNYLAASKRANPKQTEMEFGMLVGKCLMECENNLKPQDIDSYIVKDSLPVPEMKLGKNLYRVLLSIHKF